MQGRIEKTVSNFYYVRTENGAVYACKARGIFRKDGITPLVGDFVEIEITDSVDMEGSIEVVLERKNRLYRPPVANIDQALVIFAVRNPDPHLGLLNRFLVTMEHFCILPLICFNKLDLDAEQKSADLLAQYKDIGYNCIGISTKTGEGVAQLRDLLKGKVSTVAGPSGAGKSSLINVLVGESVMETGSVSKKIGRGKQTTRHSELLQIDDDSYIVDTPGFSSLMLPDMKPQDLAGCFPEFVPYIHDCRFFGCSHIKEPDCAVRMHVDCLSERYLHYVSMYEELKEQTKY